MKLRPEDEHGGTQGSPMSPLLRVAVSDRGSGAPTGQSPAPPAGGGSNHERRNLYNPLAYPSYKEPM